MAKVDKLIEHEDGSATMIYTATKREKEILMNEGMLAILKRSTGAPDWEAFGKAIMTYWPDGDVDGYDLQDMAVHYKVLVRAPEGYDPHKHGENEWGLEPGDTYFERNYT